MNKLSELSNIMFQNYPDCVNISQLQSMLGIKRTKSYELIKSGKIKAVKIGKDYKISKLNIIAFVIGEEQIWWMTLLAQVAFLLKKVIM